MKFVVFAAICCLAAVACLSAYAAISTSAPPCLPKMKNAKTKPVVYECGPATATLRAGGKTYTYRNGFCQQSKSAGLGLELDLGVLATFAKGNGGNAYLSITVAKVGGTVSAYHDGKQIANNLVVITGRFPTQGMFKSKYAGAGFGQTFSGSWNCHGTVWQGP